MSTSISRRQFVGTALAFSLLGCKTNDDPLQFGQIMSSSATLPQLAVLQGYFDHERIRVATIQEASGAAVIQQMGSVEHGLDLGVMGMPAVCAAIGQDRIHPIILATIASSTRAIKLTTFAATGVSANPATLKSQRIGYTPNTVSHQYLSRLLKRAGMTMKDIQAFAAPQSALVDNLVHGDLDGAILWDPSPELAAKRYEKQLKGSQNTPNRGEPLIIADPSVLMVTTHIVARPAVVKERRSDVIRFLRALTDAQAFLTANRDIAQQKIENWMKAPPGDLKEDFETDDFNMGLQMKSLTASLQDTMMWFKQQSPAAVVPPDLSARIDSSLLQEIDSSRVANI